MLLGSLVDLGVDLDRMRETLRSLKFEGWTLERESAQRRGLGCTRVLVRVPEEHHHRHLPEILARIESSELAPRAKAKAMAAFQALGRAEAKAHQIPIEKVHFHEVGAMDAILDICGVCIGLDELGVERVYAGAMPAGRGQVRCAHGEMPVPVPAVVNLLTRFELLWGEGEGEMITPTGAALLEAWGEPAPASLRWQSEAAGYGAGTRERSVLRLTLGQALAGDDADTRYEHDEVWVLETHLDDMTGEAVAFLMSALMDAGALDVAAAPVLMKKGRPGHALKVMVAPGPQKVAVCEQLFVHSSTLGVRATKTARLLMPRRRVEVSTPWGAVHVKVAGEQAQPEYEDCAALAKRAGVSLQAVFDAARRSAHALRSRGGADDA